ncbi:AraC family transcriptional regulator [Gordonia sp. PKS22-38]|uniref:AraC family transcriptional regulator n=1 Tax=Gordonia prachuapensis TaxID=3115651 RepID=A0ABU7MYB7_9ACTN|nr:AraC family transcriptional regulator [Gordonia sp. PKS22-38]
MTVEADGGRYDSEPDDIVFARMPDPWDHPRTTAGVAIICEWAQEGGCAPEQLLRGSGLTSESLRDSTILIEAQQEIVVIRNLLAAFAGHPAAGAEIGREYHLTSYGYYGYLLQACEVVSDMVRCGLRYSPLTFAFATMTGELVGDDRWSLVARTDGVPDDLAPFVIERDLAASVQMQRELFAGTGVAPLREVRFGHRVDGAAARMAYQDVFEVPVRFGCERSELIFDRSYLDLPLPMANPHTAAVFIEQCERLRAERLHANGIAGRVRAYLVDRPSLDCTLEACAADLHYSARTLRRALTREGTSYRAIHDDVRRGLAHDLMRDTTLPRTQIAERLGYRDWSSFSRAMRRWAGSSQGR